jgi:hypothetical protein
VYRTYPAFANIESPFSQHPGEHTESEHNHPGGCRFWSAQIGRLLGNGESLDFRSVEVVVAVSAEDVKVCAILVAIGKRGSYVKREVDPQIRTATE